MTTLDLSLPAFHDLALLRDHMLRCAIARGPLHWLQCIAESVDAFLAPRFVTTLALTLVVLGAASLAA